MVAMASMLLRDTPSGGSSEIESGFVSKLLSNNAMLVMKIATAAAVGASASPTSIDLRSSIRMPDSMSMGIQTNNVNRLATMKNSARLKFQCRLCMLANLYHASAEDTGRQVAFPFHDGRFVPKLRMAVTY